MTALFKFIFRMIKKHRKNVLVLILLSCLIVAIRFPWSEGTEKIIRNLKSKIQLPVDINFREIGLNLFSPGISFYDVQIDGESFNDTLDISQATLSLALSKWLALHPGYTIELKKKGSEFFIRYWNQKKKVDEKKKTYIYLDGKSSSLNLQDLKPFSDNIYAEGALTLKFSSNFDKKDFNTITGFLTAEGSKIQFKKFQITTPLGPLSLPNVKWREVKSKIRISSGQIHIDSIQLGTAQDPLYARFRGSVSFFFIGNRLKLKNYDIKTQIETSQSFQLNLLDLILENTRIEVPRGHLYRARIRGGRTETLRIEKLSVF